MSGISGLIGLIGLCFLITSAQAQNELPLEFMPEVVAPNVTNVFSPSRLDNNDWAQFIVDLRLENSCYRPGKPITRIDFDRFIIYLSLPVLKYKDSCESLPNNKTVTIEIGILKKPGQYRIVDLNNPQRQFGVLQIYPIDVSNPKEKNMDKYLYAPVSSVNAQRGPDGLRNILVLHGIFTKKCIRFRIDPAWDQTSTEGNLSGIPVILHKPGMLEIIPIIEIIPGDNCEEGNFPFSYPFKIPEVLQTSSGIKEVPNGRYLLHVRTLNGDSISHYEILQTSQNELDPATNGNIRRVR